MIQLAAFYIGFSHRHIFLGRPEVPDLNFNLGSVIERGTKVEKMENYDGSHCNCANTMSRTKERPYVLALKGRFTVCRGLSNRSLTRACHNFCSESFHIVSHVKALPHSSNRLLILAITTAQQFQLSNGSVLPTICLVPEPMLWKHHSWWFHKCSISDQ